jgi:cytochrome oxidase Cu insertion factor (SCO1/SenC/PrrC family)
MRKTLALALFALACHRQSDLPKLFPVPNTQLVNENNQRVTLDANKGYVTVYDFIFTNCSGTCPMMTATMRRLTGKVPKDAAVRFVSISVDPARDTPPVLRDYAKRVRNDERWTFLTGERKAIVDLSVNGFKLAAGDPGPGGDPLLHSAKFAVADKNGVIREYYGATDGDAAEHVADTVRELLREN